MTAKLKIDFQDVDVDCNAFPPVSQEQLPEGMGFIDYVFGPLETVKFNQLLPIATRVRYTHQAAVVRYRDEDWYAVEPKMELQGWGLNPSYENLVEGFLRTPVEGINKHVFVWPTKGAAYIFGYVRRAIGKSVSGTVSRSMYEEPEYEQGWCEVQQYVQLYVLKAQLPGTDYFLAPIRAVTPT